MNLPGVELITGSAHDIPIPDQSVHCIVTSPPYWGLRKYAGEQGVEWPSVEYAPMPGLPPLTIPAMRCELGLEPTPEAYIGHLILVMRELWRVLRDDGTCWVNLGDSYNSNASNQQDGSIETPYNIEVRKMGRNNKQVSSLKPKDLCGIPWRFALAAQADGWYLRSDVIWSKCLSGGTRVYARTQKGEMPMTIKDMVRLDPSTVQLWNGEKWTQALAWHETPRPDNPIEIELRSGERIGCTPEHKWPTQRGIVQAKDLQVGDVVQTTKLPQPEVPISPEFVPDEAGWFAGLYLAEGSRCKGGRAIQISSHQNEQHRFERLCRIANSYGGTCSMHTVGGNSATIVLYGHMLTGIVDTYISGTSAKSKHLSMACWQRDDHFLRSLLHGYLSGDGHWDEKNARWRLGFTRNYSLESDIRTLCARLGLQLRLKPTTATYQDGTKPAFRGEIRLETSNHHNAKDDGEIMRIGRSRARKFWDITVEDEPHLFALASGVLTHNSNPMPESVTDRPTKTHEYIFLLSKSQRYFYDADAIAEESSGQTGGGSTTRMEKAKNGDNMFRTSAGLFAGAGRGPTRNKRTVWTVSTKPFSGWAEISRLVRVASGELSGDMTHRVFADCPVHGRQNHPNGERVNDDRSHIDHIDGCHDLGQAPSGASSSKNRGQQNQACSSDYHSQRCSPSATDRSSQTSKTDHARQTSQHDTPCVQTPLDTHHKSQQHELFGQGHDNDESNTSVDDCDDNPSNQTPDHTVDKPLPRALYGASLDSLRDDGCICEFYTKTTEKTSHFAVFPPDLIEPCILAGTSAHGVCADCGAPWERVVERKRPPLEKYTNSTKPKEIQPAQGGGGMGQKLQDWYNKNPPVTTGWQPTCTCDADVIPATVLDPFNGSGTTGMVARQHGRHYIGVDISGEYLDNLAVERMWDAAYEAEGMFKPIQSNGTHDDLPLFAEVTR